MIPKDKVEEILKLTDKDLTRDLFIEWFVDKKDKLALYDMGDDITVDTTKYIKLLPDAEQKDYKPEKIDTTLGRYFIMNKLIDHENPYFFRAVGFINEPMTAKVTDGMDDKISNAVSADIITTTEQIDYFNRRDWIGYCLSDYISPSLDIDSVSANPEIEKMKEALFKKYAKELKEYPVQTANKIEQELLTKSKELMKDKDGVIIFNSGARGSFNNNYKISSIMRGATIDPVTREVSISKSNLSSGIEKDELIQYQNVLITGVYSRQMDTQKGGYLGKSVSAAYQTVYLEDDKSDCGSKGYLEVLITEDIIKAKLLNLRYIIEGGKLVLLNYKNTKEYLGKTVKLRSPFYCTTDGYCSVCAGRMYYNLQVKQIGLLFSRPAGVILNISMKAFHDQSLKIKKINIFDYIEQVA